MKVTLDSYTDPLHMGRYAGICYGKEGNDEKRLAHIIDVGHLSVLRFGMAVFRVEGISRVCLAQLTRSKHLDYLVRSSRYCDEAQADMVIPDSFERLPEALKIASWRTNVDLPAPSVPVKTKRSLRSNSPGITQS